jgi:xylan 1,4-beta-xylosidase
VCRVGDDYYLVNSSFEYFPGLPIHHSRDLVHWRLIGHVVDRVSQCPLSGVRSSGGLYAATIRHSGDTFYVACTLVDSQEPNRLFLVTAQAPEGPWSDPIWLNEAEPGIDPSLFFEQGSAWLVACRLAATPHYDGQTEIWLSRLDLTSMSLVGPRHVVWRGALRRAIWTEGPHLYKVGGTYYLLCAEGGTFFDHAVTVARSATVEGPYMPCPRNPILTNRHLGSGASFAATGHGDLVMTPGGEWWLLLHAVRPHRGFHYNLGRETCLVPVRWENGWPVPSPGRGRMEGGYPAPRLAAHPWPADPARDDFESRSLAPYWNLWRSDGSANLSLSERPGFLRLRCARTTLADGGTPSFVCRRQSVERFRAVVELEFAPRVPAEMAGIALVQSPSFHLLAVLRGSSGGTTTPVAQLVRRAGGEDEILAQIPVGAGPYRFAVEGRPRSYRFEVASRGGSYRRLGGSVDSRVLSTEVAGGFVGTLVGMYATSSGVPSEAVADFDAFEYSTL